jgi:hypothetical protein
VTVEIGRSERGCPKQQVPEDYRKGSIKVDVSEWSTEERPWLMISAHSG